MSPEQENFDALRRLLALKRHEQPPPGYFHGFSADVMARIRAGETRPDSVLERLVSEAPWLSRLLDAFEAKPVLAGAFGVLVCGLLVTGVVYSEKPTSSPVAVLTMPENAPAAPIKATEQAALDPLLGQVAPVTFSSTAGAASLEGPTGSLFEEFRKNQDHAWSQPVVFNAPR